MSAFARLLARGDDRPVFVTVSLIALVALLVWPFADWYLRVTGVLEAFKFYDFGVYMHALGNWHAGEPIYQPNEAGGYFGGYLYPPIVLLVFEPLSGLGPHVTRWTWEVGSLVALWLGLQRAIAAYGLGLAWWERGVLLWALFGFQPLLFSFKHGQVAIFVGAIQAFALAALEYGRRREYNETDRETHGETDGQGFSAGWPIRMASGALTTFAATLKLTYLPAGAHLLCDRARLAGALAAGGVLASVSLLVFGIDTHLQYLDVLRWGVESASSPKSPQLRTMAYYTPLYAVREFATAIRVLGVIAVAGLALAATEASEAADTETFALGLAAVPLLAPQRYSYTFTALLPAILALLALELSREDGYPVVPVFSLCLFQIHALGLRLLVGPLSTRFGFIETIQPAMGVLQPGLWGNLLLVGLAGFRVAEHVSVPAWLSTVDLNWLRIGRR